MIWRYPHFRKPSFINPLLDNLLLSDLCPRKATCTSEVFCPRRWYELAWPNRLYTNHTTEMTETKQKNVLDLFCQCPVKPPKPGGSHDFGVSFAGSSRALCSAALLNWPRGRNWPGDEPIESTKIYMSQRMSHDITTQGFKSWLYLVHLSVDLYYLLVCFLYWRKITASSPNLKRPPSFFAEIVALLFGVYGTNQIDRSIDP